jgi:heme exporter protein CcmD
MAVPDFGEHTPYIWAAFGLTFLVIFVLTLISVLRARAAKSRLDEVKDALADARARQGDTTA